MSRKLQSPPTPPPSASDVRRMPLCRVWASPARTRSRRTSPSNSAMTSSSPAMARPAGEVRSRVSVSDTKPTPRCSSSCNVARSATDLPGQHTRAECDSAWVMFADRGWRPAHAARSALFSSLPKTRRGFSLSGGPFYGHITTFHACGRRVSFSARWPS